MPASPTPASQLDPSGTHACLVCGGALSVRFEKVVDPQTLEHFSIEACTVCGFGQTTPQPDDLGRYYGPAYHGNRHGVTARYCNWRRLRFTQQALGAPATRALDIGCGDGGFLLTLKERGFEVYGTEMSPSIARAAGLTVEESLDAAAKHGPFGLITLWQSLEHMRDPVAVMHQAVSMLFDGGTLIAAVPDAQSGQARLFGESWVHLDVPRHLFHFGDRSLTRLFDVAGLDVTRSWHHELEIDLLGWSQSALNRLGPTPNVFFDLVTGRPVRVGRVRAAANLALGTAFTAAAVGAVAVTSALDDGGTLVVAGRKRRAAK
ncbi:MAG: class I SAM-dependent methyltransferase [Myxococcaceae bacterium]